VTVNELYDCQTPYLEALFDSCHYPWELLSKLDRFVDYLISTGIGGFHRHADGVLVGEQVRIAPTAVIEPPAVIGSGSILRPGAYVRGHVITGSHCILGNASEFKHCVLLERVQAPHYNYVGDSVLGNHAHLGAGSVCSNLKADGKAVIVHGEEEYETGLRKVGGFLGDGADVGCGCVINPGTVIGKRTSVYPLTALRGVYPADCIVKDSRLIVPREND